MIKIDEVDPRLLKKYFDNKCSPEEVREVLQWIAQSEASEELDGKFKEIWQTIKVKSGDYARWNARLDKVHERIEMESLYESLNIQEKGGRTKTKDRPAISGEMLRQDPGWRKRSVAIPIIVLFFAIGILATFYLTKPEKVLQHESTLSQKEKHTESGLKLSFHLEDGTRVQLNSNSRIIYPSKFDSLERKVILEGEAFFEVSKDTKRPFRVMTGSYVTTALGTSFNINAFEEKRNIEVALVSGEVSVESVTKSADSERLFLNPGEMVTVVKSNNTMSKASFDFKDKIAWKDGIIFFKDADYEEITNRLEDWYGVDITSNMQPVNWKFNNTFEKNETLKSILISLQFAYDFEFDIDGKNVQLKF